MRFGGRRRPQHGALDPPPSDDRVDGGTRRSTLLVLGSSLLVVTGLAAGLLALSDPDEFRSKAGLLYLLVALGGALAGFRCRNEGLSYFLPGERYEDEKIRASRQALDRVRQTSWSHRAGRSATFSSISLGIILLAAVLLVTNSRDIDSDRRTLFIWVILIASVSVMLYGISLQLWDEALGDGYDLEATLELRTMALILSSLGWLTLTLALGLAVIVVHTKLGGIVGAGGVLAALYIFEHKWRLAHRPIDEDLRQRGVRLYVGRLVTGRPAPSHPGPEAIIVASGPSGDEAGGEGVATA